MATRGAKPKPVTLRLVDGTHNVTRHGSRSKARKQVEESVASFGKLKLPEILKGEAAKAWKKYIAPAGWLDASKEPAAILFCQLWAESQYNPVGFPAAKHGQIRAYMAELGLTDDRNRNGDDGKKSDKNEFFGD